MSEKANFEEKYKLYIDISEKLKNPEISLEESVKLYSESKEIYKILKEILDKSKLEIESYED